MFALKFGFPPDVVDKMDAKMVEQFSSLLEIVGQKMKGTESIQDLLEGKT